MKILRVLLVEDEDFEAYQFLIKQTSPRELTGEDFDHVELTIAKDQDAASEAATTKRFELVFLDLRYPIHSGEAVDDSKWPGMLWLPELRKSQPDAVIIVLTGYPSWPDAVKAVRDHHANDYVAKNESWQAFCARIRDLWQAVPSYKQAEFLRHEYWTILRSQALRVHIGEVASVIRQCQNELEGIATLIACGDASAVNGMGERVRTASRRLWNGFRKTGDWLRDAVGNDTDAIPVVIDLVKDLLRPLPYLYGAEIDIGRTTPSSITLATYGADLKVSLHEIIRNSLEAGATRVEVNAARENGGATIEVKDNGSGLAPGIAGALFQRGFTTHPGDTRHSGMGLYLANRLMQDLGGNIHIRAADDRGVVATLTIPDLEAAR